MSREEQITVQLGDRSYLIRVGSGLLRQLEPFADPGSQHVVIVTDDHVAALYLDTVQQQWRQSVGRLDAIVVPAGETSKSLDQLGKLWNRLLELNADRHSTVLALGGGVVGDLAGFAAATYARGIPLVQIPTSLLAQVDSSVGGKTGINLSHSKNMVGAFWQPGLVVIDPDVLSTLPTADYVSGLAEVVKYGVIADAEFFSLLQQNTDGLNARDRKLLTRVIADCCRMKSKIVSQDETETHGKRAILNYGHTFGHAIETVFDYGTYRHGEAVAIGMHCAARTARFLNLVDDSFVQQQTQLLQSLHLPLTVPAGREDELIAAMHRDKKVSHGRLRLVLPTRIGHVELFDSPGDDVLERAFTAD